MSPIHQGFSKLPDFLDRLGPSFLNEETVRSPVENLHVFSQLAQAHPQLQSLEEGSLRRFRRFIVQTKLQDLLEIPYFSPAASRDI